MNDSNAARILSRLWFLIVGVLAISVLYLAKVLFLPLAFAVLFAFLLTPLVTALERIHLPRSMAAVVVILGSAMVLGSAGWVFFTQLIDIANDLPTYADNISHKMAAIHTPSNSAFSRAQAEVEKLGEQLDLVNPSAVDDEHADRRTARKPLGSPERPLQVRDVARSPGRLDEVGGVLEPVTTAFLTVVFTFFMILRREDLRNRVIRLTGDHNLTVTTQAMYDANRRISRYFSLQLLVNVLYGLIVCIALYFIGLPHPLLFGAFATLARFIPYVGAPIAGLIPTALSLAVFPGWTRPLLIACIYLCMEIITANYVEPHVYGKHTGLSSLAILVAAAFWTLVWGPIGLVLSVPLTVCLVVMGRHVPALEFLTVMLGDQPAISPASGFYQRLLARDEHEAGAILEKSLRDSSLEEVYDSVLIPALILSEEDRMRGDLDDSTIRFIHQTARELIEEIGFRASPEARPGMTEAHPGIPEAHPGILDTPAPAEASHGQVKVMCVPVRDDTDQLAALMLAQSLNGGSVQAVAAPVLHLDELLASVAAERPEIVFLSGVPPFGMARSHRLYQGLRARNPQLKIMIGIWGYCDDAAEAAQKISSGEEGRALTKLTEAVAELRTFLTSPGSAKMLAAASPSPASSAA